MYNHHDFTFARLSAKIAHEKGVISTERYTQIIRKIDQDETKQREAYEKILNEAKSHIKKEMLIS